MACITLETDLVEGIDYDIDLVNGLVRFKSTGLLGPTLAGFIAAGGCGARVDYCTEEVAPGLNIVCPIVLKECIPCNDDPVLNISAEDADSSRFVFNIDLVRRPPMGVSYSSLGCARWCYSTESLFDAQLCATEQVEECINDDWRAPPTGDFPHAPAAPPPLYANTFQECSASCSDGTSFGASIAAGRVVAPNQAEANRIAFSLACQRARQLKVCISTDTPLDGACSGAAYTKTFVGRGGTPWVVTFGNTIFAPFCANIGDHFPYVWSVVGGTLPGGLELGACSGILEGTPTATGTFSFTVRATDALGSFMNKVFNLTVASITTASPLPNAAVGTVYSQNLTVEPTPDANTEVWTVTAGTLPPGLELTGDGIVEGTPTGPGNTGYQFTAQVVFELNGGSVTCSKQFELTTNLIEARFYWTFDNTLIDSVESIPMVPDALLYGTGIISGGFRFQSSLNALVKLETTDALISYTAGQSISYSCWINWAFGFDANDQLSVFTDNSAGAGDLDLSLRLQTILGVLNVILSVDNGVASSQVQAPFTPVIGTWYFLTVVYDADTDIAKLYINAVQTLTTTAVALPTSAAGNKIASWQVGSIGGSSLDYVFDEFGFYSQALNQTMIDYLYNSGAANRPAGI